MIDNNSFFRRTIVRQVLILLFWITGFSVSVSLIVWIRSARLALGNTFFVSSAVFITFLIGIAGGSYYFGKLIDTKRQELQTYLWLELIAGLYLFMLLIIFPLLSSFHKAIFNHIGDQILLMNTIKFLILFLILITPSTLIGATYPILSRFFIQSSERVSREVGNLFGISMFGAAVGCFLTGFVLLQFFGIRQTFILAASLNLFNATIIRFLLKNIEPTVHLETEFYDQKLKHLTRVTTPQSKLLKQVILIGIGISGLIAISYLVLWGNCFTYIMENSTYTSPITLSVFLIGLSIGAFFYPRFLEQGNLFYRFAIIEIIIGALGIISVMLITQLPILNKQLWHLVDGSNSWNWRTLIYFYDASIIILIPTILIGMTIPLVCKIYLINFEERGKIVGSIYALNVFGGILGLILTGFILLPKVGIQKSIIFLALINFLIGLVILFISMLKYGKMVRTSMIFGLVAAIFALSLLIPSNMIIKLFENLKNNYKVVYIKEGINTTTTIHHHNSQNELILASNGVAITGTSKEWLTTQRFYGHLPLLLHVKPDTILAIGFREGETLASVFLHHVTSVDCIDNTPDILKVSSLLTENRNDFASNPNFHLVPVYGKNFVSASNKKYDIIINAVIHPAFDENASLLSLEFFQNCRNKLNINGIISCVIPLFRISIEDFKVIINTFHSVFPFTTLWYPNNCLNQYAFLIGSMDPKFEIDYKQIATRLKDPNILVNLSQIGMDNIYEILDAFIMGPKTLTNITEGVQLNNDNTPFLEFSTPKIPDTPSNWNQILQLLASYREPVFPYLTNIDSTMEQREFTRLILDNYYQSTELVFNALNCELLGKPERALQIYRQVYMMNRFDRGAKRFMDTYFDSLLVTSPQTPAEFIQNATIYYQKMEYEEAINFTNKALELNPDYAPAYFSLGINYEIMRDFKKAKEMYQKTLKLKPNLQQARDRLDSLSLKLGN